jgi:hypothetical protein
MVGTVHFGIVQRMTAPRQGDLFGNEGPDPSDDDFETPVYYPDPDKVREELRRILAEARAAETIPWDANRTALYCAIFPQMTGVCRKMRARSCALISKPKWPGWKQHNPRVRGARRASGPQCADPLL